MVLREFLIGVPLNRFVRWFRSYLDRVLGKGATPVRLISATRRRVKQNLAVESLEDRLLMSAVPTIAWDSGAGSDRSWSNALNWTDDRLPTAADDVDIRVASE